MTCTDPLPLPDLERESLIEILQRMRPRIKRLLKGYDIPYVDAEDLLQETILEALRKWDTIRHMEAWLLGTLRFKCSNYWKRQRNERVQAMDLDDLEDLSEPQPPAQEREEILIDLRHLARSLGKRHRAVLWLRFGLGLSTEEVAERLGYCPSSIRKLTGRSMARLQRWMSSASGSAGIPTGPLDGSD
jgi:RNA polymerase sigma factor (sigma-70 family)